METAAPIDPSRCPLCGRSNDCAMAAARTGEPCWCTRVTVTAVMLKQVPADLRGRACLCAACIARLAANTG
jgi:hypothetical protein